MTKAQCNAPYREWGLTRSARTIVTDFFGAGSPYLSHPLLTEERTSLEIDRILSWLPDAPAEMDVLDMGCGFGRHAIELARRGMAVVGVDPSATLLGEARSRAEHEGLPVEFVQASGDQFVREGEFDLALCMFTTLGQVQPPDVDPKTHAILTNLSRAMRPGATLVLEVPEKGRAVEALVESEQLGPTAVARSFDPATSVLSERFDTPTDSFALAYVLFTQAELVQALESAGFTISATYDEAVQAPPFTFMTIVAKNEGSAK